MAGDCFVAALDAARTYAARGCRVLICHGRPLGTGGEAEGLRYWHAWAEVRASGGWLVVDDSNGRSVIGRRADYYRLGSIPAAGDHVRRFTLAEAARQMVRYKHYGPWVPDDEMDNEWREHPAGA